MNRIRRITGIALILAASVTLLAAALRATASASDVAIMLPTDRPVVRIEVDTTGIYEIDYATLAALGMWPNGVNPKRFEMMHRGQAVAYEIVGDGDSLFEPGEKIRFYGWGIESRYDKLFVDRNVFWLWGGGNATHIAREPNARHNPPLSGYTSVITFEHDLFFTPTYVRWSSLFDNPPDAWYWDFLQNNIMVSYPLTLPHALASGPDAQYTVELFSRNVYDNRATIALAGDPTPHTRLWSGRRSVNVKGSVAQALLQTEPLTLTVHPSAVGNSDQRFNLNRVTVSYLRDFTADSGALDFSVTTPGAWRYDIGGLAGAAAVIAWDISDRHRPVALNGVTPGEPVAVGRSVVDGQPLRMLVTDEQNVRAPLAVTRYRGHDLAPANASADWLAIGYADFLPSLERLAAYRAATDGLATHIVSVEDVYNQYGYGLATPAAIKRYVQQAYDAWGVDYLLLGGDATQNPTGRPCAIPAPACVQNWNQNLATPTFVVTDLVFEDRFLGLIPTDHSFTLLAGNDLLPDIAVGRMAARTAAEMDAMVDKTIRYDSSVRAVESWTQRLLFVADNADAGGEFCYENNDLLTRFVPGSIAALARQLCLDEYLQTGRNSSHLRNDLFEILNSGQTADPRQPGIVNYRGHGGINDWAGGMVRSTTHAGLWDNADFPPVILSADCLDGHFAWLGNEGLSETFFRLRNAQGTPVGSAAHWGATGLGYSFEHAALYNEFYDALFRERVLTIGAAINSSKRDYVNNGSGAISEVYSMTLHGDPALRLANSSVPTAVSISTLGSQAADGWLNALLPFVIVVLAVVSLVVLRRRRIRR